MFLKFIATIVTVLISFSCSDQSSNFNGSRSSSQKSPAPAELDAFENDGKFTKDEQLTKDEQEECREGDQGRIIVSHDEWTFSNQGFDEAPDTGRYIKNIVGWLKSCGKSTNNKFHALSNDFSLNESELASIMSQSSYSYTKGVDEDLSLENLKQYDWIYLAGPVAGVDAFTLGRAIKRYIDQGGNVYVSAGTGDFNGASREAAYFNSFLSNYGLKYESSENQIRGTITPNSDHTIFSGISSLYHKNGNSVSLTGSNAKASILESYTKGGVKHGLFGIFDGRLAD